MGFGLFFRDQNDFAAKTEFEIVLEYFCGIEVGLRIIFSEEKRDEKLYLDNFFPNSEREKGSWT